MSHIGPSTWNLWCQKGGCAAALPVRRNLLVVDVVGGRRPTLTVRGGQFSKRDVSSTTKQFPRSSFSAANAETWSRCRPRGLLSLTTDNVAATMTNDQGMSCASCANSSSVHWSSRDGPNTRGIFGRSGVWRATLCLALRVDVVTNLVPADISVVSTGVCLL
jgi:hypothetical protein